MNRILGSGDERTNAAQWIGHVLKRLGLIDRKRRQHTAEENIYAIASKTILTMSACGMISREIGAALGIHRYRAGQILRQILHFSQYISQEAPGSRRRLEYSHKMRMTTFSVGAGQCPRPSFLDGHRQTSFARPPLRHQPVR